MTDAPTPPTRHTPDTKPDMSGILAALNYELEHLLADQAEEILRGYGLKNWRLTLVARHPDGVAHAEEFTITTSDNLKDVAALVAAKADA